jgi:hypothetical protein
MVLSEGTGRPRAARHRAWLTAGVEGSWPPMVWVGGTPGTGKTTLARRLAHEHDLPLHPVDVVAPEARTRQVVDDVRERGAAPVVVVVEGPQLEPALATHLPPGHAVFLVATPQRLREVHAVRDREDDAEAPRQVDDDLALDARTRSSARQAGAPLVEVGTAPDWSQVAGAVTAVVGPALRRGPRLDPGAPLRAVRRWENAATCRRLQRLQSARGLATTWRFPFACECGRSGCTEVWLGRPEEYDTAGLAGRAVAPEHR